MTQARVLRNSERITRVAADALAEDGWSALAPTTVSRRSGLSPRAVSTRYPTRPDVGAAAWHAHAGPTLQATLTDILTASGLLDAPGSEADFVAVMRSVAQPSVDLLAAAELLVLARFEPVLREALDATLAPTVAQWCEPVPGKITRAGAARRAYLLMVALGLIAAGRRPGAADLDLTDEITGLHRVLLNDLAPVRLPTARALHAHQRTAFDTGDPIHDDLLTATLDRVGHLGFDAATTMTIASAAGHSETTIFIRYPSKLALFIDAAARQQAIAFRANEAFTERLEARHGLAIAEAVNIREFLHPDLDLQRAIYAETIRMSWHDEELRDRQEAEITTFIDEMHRTHADWPAGTTEAAAHMSYATGIGYALLPLLAPDAWTLPYDVVTRALPGSA